MTALESTENELKAAGYKTDRVLTEGGKIKLCAMKGCIGDIQYRRFYFNQDGTLYSDKM